MSSDLTRRDVLRVIALVLANTLTTAEIAAISAMPGRKVELPPDFIERLAPLVGRPMQWAELPEVRRFASVVGASWFVAQLELPLLETIWKEQLSKVFRSPR